MKEQKIKQAFDTVTLTRQEKNALLENILSASGHRPAERKRTMKYKKTLLIGLRRRCPQHKAAEAG